LSSIALIRSGYEGRSSSRFDSYFGGFVAIGKALPKDAKLLLHASHRSLGIDRDTLQDAAGFQGLIDYSRARSPRELYEYFRSLGITHVLDGPGHGEATRQEQAIYYVLLRRYGVPVSNSGGALFALPREAPPEENPYQVLCVGVPGYADGLYPVETLDAADKLPVQLRHYNPPARPYTAGDASNLAEFASEVLMGTGEYAVLRDELGRRFEQLHVADGVSIYARRR
jgi:hypothetical protein